MLPACGHRCQCGRGGSSQQGTLSEDPAEAACRVMSSSTCALPSPNTRAAQVRSTSPAPWWTHLLTSNSHPVAQAENLPIILDSSLFLNHKPTPLSSPSGTLVFSAPRWTPGPAIHPFPLSLPMTPAQAPSSLDWQTYAGGVQWILLK